MIESTISFHHWNSNYVMEDIIGIVSIIKHSVKRYKCFNLGLLLSLFCMLAFFCNFLNLLLFSGGVLIVFIHFGSISFLSTLTEIRLEDEGEMSNRVYKWESLLQHQSSLDISVNNSQSGEIQPFRFVFSPPPFKI